MAPNTTPSRLIIFIIVFVDLLGFGVMIPMLPFFARSFGASAFEVGLLMFVYSFMQIFAAPLWGQLSDRIGRRPVLLITILGQALAFLWAGMSMSFMSLLLSRMAAGLFAGNISTASAYMADITPPQDRAKGMGLIGAAFGLGFIFGPAVGGVLIPYGVHWPSIVAAAICILNFVLAFSILKEPPIEPHLRELNRRKLSWALLKTSFSNPRLFYPMFGFFLATFAFVQLEITFGLFVLDRFKLTESDAAFLFAFLGITMAVVQGVMLGPLTKRFSERGLILSGSLIAVFGLMGVTLVSSFYFLLAALVLIACGYSLMNPCLSSLTSKATSPGQQGAIMGLYQSGGGVARVLAPLGAGFLYDHEQILPFLSAALIVSVLFAIWLVKGRDVTVPVSHAEQDRAQGHGK